MDNSCLPKRAPHAVVAGVRPGSIAAELGLAPGDEIVALNGEPLRDLVQYKFHAAEARVELGVRRADGEEWVVEVEKDEGEELGIEFTEPTFDGVVHCRNKCIFCFLHQSPRGLRRSLCIPDDDYRLSFLGGYFVTLTNLGEDDFRRIIRQRLSPLYVSVHVTDPELRLFMMKNPRSGEILNDLQRLSDVGIEIHTQLVLCPGVNDGPALDRSVADLAAIPGVRSIASVPVGLTRFRERLYPLEPYDRERARAVVAQVVGWQRRLAAAGRTHLLFLADEFYLTADVPLPPLAAYGDLPQLENGVGLVRLFWDQFRRAAGRLLRNAAERLPPGGRRVTVVTGISGARVLAPLVERLNRVAGLSVRVLPVENDFFGPTVTVAGLLCGGDIMAALRRNRGDLGDEVLVPGVALGQDGRFIDDRTLAEVGAVAEVPVKAVRTEGAAFARAVLGPAAGPAAAAP